MNQNAELIQRFYAAFDARDADGMVACYGPAPTFRDPVFGLLKGEEVGSMWRMLVGRSKDLGVAVRDVSADDRTGGAHWTARYTFSTGRPVVNEVDARFTFTDGLIATHVDTFDLWRWTRQALGPTGLVLGWTPIVHKQVREKARAQLDAYLAGQATS